jgi:hypothetical protein
MTLTATDASNRQKHYRIYGIDENRVDFESTKGDFVSWLGVRVATEMLFIEHASFDKTVYS